MTHFVQAFRKMCSPACAGRRPSAYPVFLPTPLGAGSVQGGGTHQILYLLKPLQTPLLLCRLSIYICRPMATDCNQQRRSTFQQPQPQLFFFEVHSVLVPREANCHTVILSDASPNPKCKQPTHTQARKDKREHESREDKTQRGSTTPRDSRPRKKKKGVPRHAHRRHTHPHRGRRAPTRPTEESGTK